MRIGFLLQATTALAGPGDGVRIQAAAQAQALERRGHAVIRLNPWEAWTDEPLDVTQFFTGGLGFYGIDNRGPGRGLMVFAPIIDSNVPTWQYRLAAAAGRPGRPRAFTIPGELRRQALASDLVICRSTHEQQRVVKGLGIPLAKTAIVLNGVNPPPASDGNEIRRRLDLPDDFVLHVSAYTQQRKNVVRLVEAIGPLGLPLVIAGTAEPGATQDRLRQLCERLPQVRLLGFQRGEDLQGLYAACRVFCLPSQHEGTGLAALEAAAQGASIVITRNGGAQDYFGPWAEYVDPSNTQEIREAVQRSWRQPRSTILRDQILQTLTWDQSAEALEAAYLRKPE